MRYMLLVYLDEQALSDSEREHCYVESARLARDLNASGNYVSAGPLHPTATATSVRVRNGKRLVTDGPFAETREQLGGYFLIDAEDLDEAISIAAQIPGARIGVVEIRPLMAIRRSSIIAVSAWIGTALRPRSLFTHQGQIQAAA